MNPWIASVRRPSLPIAAAISATLVALMVFLKFAVFPDRVVPLNYALALLVVLWHRNRWLLWAMAACFLFSTAHKILWIIPPEHFTEDPQQLTLLAMHWTNVLIAAAVLHAVVNYREHLETANSNLTQANTELDVSNEELIAHEEEISRQNEELRQQAEELELQTEELQALNTEIFRRERTLQALLHLSGPTTPEIQLLNEICAAAPQLLGEEMAAAILERNEDHLVVRGHSGFELRDLSATRLPLKDTLAWLAMQRNQTAHLDDVRLRPDLRIPQPANGPPFHSILAAPLYRQGQVIGALEVYTHESRSWTPEQAQLLEWMAAQCSQALEILRLRDELREINQALEAKVARRTAELQRRSDDLRRLASQLTSAEQRERRRLAEALHDDLQQLLVAAKIRLSSQRVSWETLRDSTADLIDQAIERSRSLTIELSPPVLFQQPFDRALHWLARRFQEKHGLEVSVHTETDAEPAGQDWRVFLFHAVGECLFNTVKHATVQRAEVRTQRHGQQLCVLVEDHGRGFDVTTLQKNPEQADNFGLFSLQQRCMLLGGSINIQSEPRRGTRVEFLAPLTSPDSHVPATSIPQPAGGDSQTHPSSQPRDDEHIRVLLADDHAILRNGLARILHHEPGIEVVAEASDGQTAVELARAFLPDVVVMDVSMPKLNGIEATQALVAELPSVKVIGMSMHEDGETSAAMFKAGAISYLTKGGPATELIETIRRAVVSSRQAVTDPAFSVAPRPA